jgi:hypothetical protein
MGCLRIICSINLNQQRKIPGKTAQARMMSSTKYRIKLNKGRPKFISYKLNMKCIQKKSGENNNEYIN